jgi:transcriptional regulator with XRE-family HTH domain
MGILSKIREILHLGKSKEALESASKRFEALESAVEAMRSDEISKQQESINLQKNSLELGVAAGYTAHFIKRVESSLDKIESQILTKEWFDHKFDEKSLEFSNLIKIHEENEQKRFEILQNILMEFQKALKVSVFRKELSEASERLEELPLTPKMNELLEILKQYKELSYEELASRLGITISSLRGLLSKMSRRTDEIERFEKDNKGWVRYKGKSASKRFESLESESSTPL